MRFFALVAVFTAISSPCASQTGAQCATMQNPDARLSCYDALFVQTAPAPTPAPGQWRVSDARSSLDDTRRVVLTLDSTEPMRGRFGRNEHAILAIRCEENTTSLFINWGGHFMSDLNQGGRVDYRIDARPPGNVTMRVSNNNMALGLWNGRSSIPFIRSLVDGDELYVRATPFSESRIEARFPISGLADAIRPLREACRW
jgi:type VI secretion system protein VasI